MMDKIPPTMVLQNNVDGEDTIFTTMSVPLMKIPLRKWIEIIRRGAYQAESGEVRWEYELVSDLCPDLEPNSDSNDDGSSDKVIKDQGNPEDQQQEEVLSVTCRNPRRFGQCDQR